MSTRQFTILIGLGIGLWGAGIHAGMHKCSDAQGNVTFSDLPCPDATVQDERIRVPRSRPAQVEPDTYWSIGNQLSRMKAEKAEAKRKRARMRAAARSTAPRSGSAPSPQTAGVPMTYAQAKQKALADAGYRNYGSLTRAQKRTVDQEIAKYTHLPKPVSTGVGSILASQERMAHEQARRLQKEQENIREVERQYEREKRWQELGARGREHRFRDAVKECDRTFMAQCR